MNTDHIDIIKRSAAELEAIAHLLQAIAETESLDAAQALAQIGKEHASKRANWLRAVLSREPMKTAIQKRSIGAG